MTNAGRPDQGKRHLSPDHARRPKDVIDNARERLGGIDENAARCLFPSSVQAKDEFAFSRSCAPLAVRSLVQPPDERVYTDIQDEHAVKEVDEGREVPRASAEKVTASSRLLISVSTASTRQM